jgi:hypothetical protein
MFGSFSVSLSDRIRSRSCASVAAAGAAGGERLRLGGRDRGVGDDVGQPVPFRVTPYSIAVVVGEVAGGKVKSK